MCQPDIIPILQPLIKQYDFNLLYATRLIHDLSEEQMTIVPGKGLENHPAFTLGHLAVASASLAESLGADLKMPEGWNELFSRKGPGDPRRPSADISSYPAKKALLQELESQHNKVKSILCSMNETQLAEKVKWRFEKHMPTLLDLATFLCINHEIMHLGQLAAWRRAMDLPSALAAL